MRIFPHGNVVNFQSSVREMTAPELETLIKRAMEQGSMITGCLNLEQSELVVYGQAIAIQLDEQSDQVILTTQTDDGTRHSIETVFSDLSISHEMHFDIEESEGKTLRYTVYYLTFTGDSAATSTEKTWFFANSETIAQPLDCVVEFWRQGGEAGRDADFSTSGCGIPPSFGKSIKR
ncbi:hypothetical protein [Desmospora activa]|uniref:Uncharacterized protein n=1 Tax=Desmospora activa DSM 45169 TaxID=1121389 RepID=A0A2T4ZCV2_9BACL|nr:hypothetical protein [Desmospora activa]PTM59706.1 hypothetical protein C8J48_2336 [Desmospora activa DSM 45169]